MQTQKNQKDKIHEALELLEQAAKEKKEDISGAIHTKYDHLREVFAGVAEHGQDIAGAAKKKISKVLHDEEEKVKEVMGELNKKVRQNPWGYIGGVALGSLFLGMVLRGRSSRRRRSKSDD